MANPAQINRGLLQRLRARAFVAANDVTNKRIAFVSIDAGSLPTIPKTVHSAFQKQAHATTYHSRTHTHAHTHSHTHTQLGMSGTVMKNRVVAALDQRFPGLYSHDNVGISGTHTYVSFLFSS